MPKVTLYVRDADQDVWERARALSGRSFSNFVTEALRVHIMAHESSRSLPPLQAALALLDVAKREEGKARALLEEYAAGKAEKADRPRVGSTRKRP